MKFFSHSVCQPFWGHWEGPRRHFSRVPICILYYWHDSRTDLHLDGCGWAEGKKWNLTHLPLTWERRRMPILAIWEFQRQLKHGPHFLGIRFYIVYISSVIFCYNALQCVYLSPVWLSNLCDVCFVISNAIKICCLQSARNKLTIRTAAEESGIFLNVFAGMRRRVGSSWALTSCRLRESTGTNSRQWICDHLFAKDSLSHSLSSRLFSNFATVCWVFAFDYLPGTSESTCQPFLRTRFCFCGPYLF